MYRTLAALALVWSPLLLTGCPDAATSEADGDATSVDSGADSTLDGSVDTADTGVDTGNETTPDGAADALAETIHPDIAPTDTPDDPADAPSDSDGPDSNDPDSNDAISIDAPTPDTADASPNDASDSGDTTPEPDAASDISQDTVPDVPADTTQDVSTDGPSDIPADTPTDTAPELPDVPSDIPTDTAPELPDVPSDIPTDTAPELPDVPSDIPADTPQDTTPDIAQDTTPDVPDTDTTTPANPPQNSVPFTYSTTCSLPDDPQTSGFEEQFVPKPPGTILDLTHAGDGSGRIFVAEREGTVYLLGPPHEVVLDISSLVDADGEGGLLAIAFDPDFEANGYMYVSYTSSTGGQFRNVWARYTFNDPTGNVADPTSGVVFLELDQPYTNHNGGDIAFGHDGYLYMTSGDGGVGPNPNFNEAQNLDSLFGKILRIDVSTVGPASSYSIPPDNPFVGMGGGVREEIYAYGFRNPWRMSVDRLTGDIWVGDVGQADIEEIDIVTSGANYGWPWWEGTLCFNASNGCDTTGFTMPTAEYTHDHGASVTGGFVYRGSAIPSLYGAYIYSEAWNGNYWTYRHGLEAPSPTPEGVIGGAYSYGEDEDGELYLMNWGIRKLVPSADTGPPPAFPTTLTETGCFSNVAALTPGTGLVPFEPRAPLWSDHVKKKRWVSLPPGGQIGYDSTGKWVFPTGTIFIKHFEADVMDNGGTSLKRLETRLVVQDDDGVRGYTYRWNDAQTEAFLLPGADSEVLTVVPESGGPITMTWSYPSQSQCLGCHTEASGGQLGLETAQLNWATPTVDYPEIGAVNQVAAFGAYGLFDTTLPVDLAAEPLLTNLADTSATDQQRARSYLHANCGNCHLPGGPSGLNFDLRYTASLAETGTCGQTPLRGDLGIPGAELLKAGNAGESIIYARMATDGPNRMPPLGTELIHTEAVDAVNAWINGIQACP